MKKWKCNRCNAMVKNAELLLEPSPFAPSETLTACPRCKQCEEGFAAICDWPGCRDAATCGHPHPEGYRQTCGAHYMVPLPS